MSRVRRYCFTVNNPDISVSECLDIIKKYKILRAVVGVEHGSENGTRHLQGFVHYKNAVGFEGFKKLLPRAHIEKSRGSDLCNYKYCTKDGEFETLGEFDSCRSYGDDTGSGDKIKDALLQFFQTDDQSLFNTGLYVRNKDRMDARINEISDGKYKRSRYFELFPKGLLSWQLHVLRRLLAQNDRVILWVHDDVGGVGKSWFARYLHYVFGADLFDGVTNAAAVTQMLSRHPRYIVFDVARSNSDGFSYNTLECIKDGFIMSWKYRGLIRRFEVPLVLVLSNVPPNKDALSKDRWEVINLIDFNGLQDKKTYPIPEEITIPRAPPDPLPLPEEDTVDSNTSERSVNQVQEHPGGSPNRVDSGSSENQS